MINISIRTTEEIIMNELLKIEHARKVYQSRFKGVQVEALKDIQLEVNKGEYTAIMGESGSGKSTLLNMIATLDKPTSGKLYLNGESRRKPQQHLDVNIWVLFSKILTY